MSQSFKQNSTSIFLPGDSGLSITPILLNQRSDLVQIGCDEAAKSTSLGAIFLDNDGIHFSSYVATNIEQEIQSKKFDSIDEVSEFFLDNILTPNSDLRVCVDTTVLQDFVDNQRWKDLARHLAKDGQLTIHPVSLKLTQALTDYISENDESDTWFAKVAINQAANNLFRFFIHLSGMAHSAQDIISYFKMHLRLAGQTGIDKNPMDMVFANIPEGNELFLIQKTPESPVDCDAISLGLCYFSIFHKYSGISQSLATKLALAGCCQQLRLVFGYAIGFHFNKETK